MCIREPEIAAVREAWPPDRFFFPLCCTIVNHKTEILLSLAIPWQMLTGRDISFITLGLVVGKSWPFVHLKLICFGFSLKWRWRKRIVHRLSIFGFSNVPLIASCWFHCFVKWWTSLEGCDLTEKALCCSLASVPEDQSWESEWELIWQINACLHCGRHSVFPKEDLEASLQLWITVRLLV